MTTLMRNGRDRRSGKPVMGHAILERALLVGTRSADHIRASSHSGCIATGQASARKTGRIHGCTRTLRRKVRFLLHRGHRPYMALFVISLRCNDLSAFGPKRTRHERQIVGVPFSPRLRRSPTAPKGICFLGRLVGEVAPTNDGVTAPDMRAATAHRHSASSTDNGTATAVASAPAVNCAGECQLFPVKASF